MSASAAGGKDQQQFLPALRRGHAQCHFLYKGRAQAGHRVRGHLPLCQHGGGGGVSGDEADVLGSFRGRHGASPYRNVLPGVGSDIFIGMVGEYILAINSRVMKRPLVIEEERINFDREEEQSDET